MDKQHCIGKEPLKTGYSFDFKKRKTSYHEERIGTNRRQEMGKDLAKKEQTNIVEHPSVNQTESPAMMMIRAKEAGLDAEQMKQMLEVQKDWEANEALKAFNLAVADFRLNPPVVYKDKKNKQYGDSAYVSLPNMVNTVSAELCKYGLSVRWSFGTDERNIITCTCTLSHKLGHAESVTVDGPPDESGKKNVLQARKSTRTYLKLESFEAVTGMASSEGSADDDGNSFGIEVITDDQITVLTDLIAEVKADKVGFLKYLKVKSLDELPVAKYDAAKNALEAKKS